MQQRGKKTAAALVSANVVEVTPRQIPPAELSELESGIWLSVVNTKPADWFQADTTQLMIAYCKHTSTAMTLDKQINEFDPAWLADNEGIDRYQKLINMREKQTRAIVTLSRTMRLTQQSRYDAQVAATTNKKTSTKKPWEG